MTAVLQCPNPSCGRRSQLGEDPLGRIFRCPRCLTKLPTSAAALSDSGWTRVLGPLPRRQPARLAHEPTGLAGTRGSEVHAAAPEAPGRPWTIPLPMGLETGPTRESGEFLAVGFDSQRIVRDTRPGRPDPRPSESGEVFIEAFDHEDWSEDPLHHPHARGPVPGDKQLGRFEILGVLGAGKHSTVYRAFDPLLQRPVAVKRLRPAIAARPRGLQRFLGEARALAQLHHPRIVPIYEAGCDRGRYYLAMELIEGQSLEDRLMEGPLPFHQVAALIRELAEALAYTHDLGIIHRDIKPANIRLDREGCVFLMDFGIAYLPESDEVPLPPGLILGTPAYVAPEQARGVQAEISPASDQYSLGAVFYELLCGKPPFLGPLPHVLVHRIHHEPAAPRAVQPRVPRPLDAICRRAMARDPEDRYPSCRELANDLHLWLRGKTPSVQPRRWAFLSF